jgi:hypothetical protein
MGQVAESCHYIFQQDRGPAHTNKRTQDWLKESLTEVFEKQIWPPSSTDCHSFVWISGVSGFPKIKEVMRSFDRNTMAKACMSFRPRMEAVFTADGSFIEYFDCQYVSLLTFFFISIKSVDFQLRCAIIKKEEKNSGFIAAPLYICTDPDPSIINKQLNEEQPCSLWFFIFEESCKCTLKKEWA